ncbi:MAG: hypothetical protein A2W91_00665 [Bacteroidetes bacterium GWF2_38_335]|nr:MAG: hypothetical protein A2W91_00665 [Bacteroidetes bacterium GWF2_38_335]OFY78344.1 MAG: hypothetical protein A2281_04045 [Bacteroidetes bacterium RIFOXYA12_FULL_38_20]HBS87459.1 hypothetical protein [Bacteroidales bacterium]
MMKVNFTGLLIKAGADIRVINDDTSSFEELGMIPIEKDYFLNLVEDEFKILFKENEIKFISTIREVAKSISDKIPA